MYPRRTFELAKDILAAAHRAVLRFGDGSSARGRATGGTRNRSDSFPWRGLISYNSVFITRGLQQESPPGISSTARPTFCREGDFNFTWGFRSNFDLTVLVPVVTNHFASAGGPTVGGTGPGDTMLLVKYRFYRRDSARGTTPRCSKPRCGRHHHAADRRETRRH